MSDGEESDGEMEIESDSPQLTKKARDMSASTSVIQKNEDIPSLNYPLPGETRSPCLVKVCPTYFLHFLTLFLFQGL